MSPERSAPGVQDAQDPLLGTLVGGRYRIEARLGQGGMGAVYRATHLELQRSVAVKVLMAELVSNESAVERFLREARICASLGHPNIIDVYDLGRLEDGRPYLVMELLQGRNVGDALLEQHRFAPSRVAWLVNEVSAALTAVHRRGVIHRDIKPDNLFLITHEDGSEGVKVLDFGLVGLAMPGPGDKRLTRVGSIFGTPEYMAPEAASSAPQDARADLYALGITAMECLTGALPFEDANPLVVLTKKLGPVIPRLGELCELRFPDELEAVIARAIAPVPAERQASVAEFAAELSTAIAKMSAPCSGDSRAPQDAREVEAQASQLRLRTVPLEKPLLPEPAEAPSAGTLAASVSAEPSVAATSSARRKLLGAGLVLVALVLLLGGIWAFGASSRVAPVAAGGAGSEAAGRATPSTASLTDTLGAEPRAGLEGVDTPSPVSPDAGAANAASAVNAASAESVPEAAAPSTEAPPSAPSAHARAARDRRRVVTADPARPPVDAVDDSTPSASALTAQGTSALAQGRLTEAVADYRLATRVSPRYAPAWRALGVAQERLGRSGDAAVAYRRYLSLAPDAPDAAVVRARLDRL